MFNGTQLARFDYGFDDLNRMKYEQRGATADGYAYDKAGEVTGFNRDGTLSNGVVTGGATMGLIYDFAGNRSQVTNNGTATNYSVNNLNEYTAVGSEAVESDVKGNVKTCNIKTYAQTNETWTYTYDAQNRLRLATGGGKTLEFWYDGKNRQITRRINGDNNQITRSVWDGWDLLEERDVNDAPREYYLHGARTDELVLRWGGSDGDHWYGYDGRGNVSHLFAYIYNGLITESYTYDLAGAPTFSGPNNQSLVENRFLFQGRDYLKEGGIYDYRNRFYHPGLGRFLQPDPIGFKGDGGNLYRYCGNDPVDRGDPTGLIDRDWNAVVRAIDQCNLILYFQTEAQSGAGATSTTGLPNARERAEGQGLNMAPASLHDPAAEGSKTEAFVKTTEPYHGGYAAIREARKFIQYSHPDMNPNKYKYRDWRIASISKYNGHALISGIIIIDTKSLTSYREVVSIIYHELIHKAEGFVQAWRNTPAEHHQHVLKADQVGREYFFYPDPPK